MGVREGRRQRGSEGCKEGRSERGSEGARERGRGRGRVRMDSTLEARKDGMGR
jgi:hypothetical protein